MDIVARILNFTLMITMPIGLAVFLARRFKTEWKLFGIGCVTFILSQVFHIPFNLWVLNPLMGKMGLNLAQSKGIQLAVIGLLLGLSAGLFEEITRYLGYKFWIKDQRDWKSALKYGAGHGGIESILIGILAMLTFIQIMSLRGTDLTTAIPAAQIELARSQIEAYWAAPWYLALLGAVERLIAIIFHLSATVLVLESFRRKRFVWVIYAILWHTILDGVAVFAVQTWNPYIAEGLLGVLGIMSLAIIFKLKSTNEPASLDESPILPTRFEIGPVVPSEENLEDSRYA